MPELIQCAHVKIRQVIMPEKPVDVAEMAVFGQHCAAVMLILYNGDVGNVVSTDKEPDQHYGCDQQMFSVDPVPNKDPLFTKRTVRYQIKNGKP